MGMFDHVAFAIDCPVCGTRVDGFQTKDDECVLAMLAPWRVRNFYSSCDKCDAWIEFMDGKLIEPSFDLDRHEWVSSETMAGPRNPPAQEPTP